MELRLLALRQAVFNLRHLVPVVWADRHGHQSGVRHHHQLRYRSFLLNTSSVSVQVLSVVHILINLLRFSLIHVILSFSSGPFCCTHHDQHVTFSLIHVIFSFSIGPFCYTHQYQPVTCSLIHVILSLSAGPFCCAHHDQLVKKILIHIICSFVTGLSFFTRRDQLVTLSPIHIFLSFVTGPFLYTHHDQHVTASLIHVILGFVTGPCFYTLHDTGSFSHMQNGINLSLWRCDECDPLKTFIKLVILTELRWVSLPSMTLVSLHISGTK